MWSLTISLNALPPTLRVSKEVEVPGLEPANRQGGPAGIGFGNSYRVTDRQAEEDCRTLLPSGTSWRHIRVLSAGPEAVGLMRKGTAASYEESS